MELYLHNKRVTQQAIKRVIVRLATSVTRRIYLRVII